MQIPKLGERNAQQIFSIDEGYAKYWDKATAEYVNSKKFPKVRKIKEKKIIFDN